MDNNKTPNYNFSFEQFFKHVDNALITFDQAIQKTLKDLKIYIPIERCYFYKIDDSKLFITYIQKKHSKTLLPKSDRLQEALSKSQQYLLNYLEKHQYLAINSVSTLSSNLSLLKNELLAEKIKSTLIVPLISKNKIFAFMGFDTTSSIPKWNAITIQLLTNFSRCIAQTLDWQDSIILLNKKKQLELLLTKKLLNTAENELAFFIKSVPTPISIFDQKLRYVTVSDCWRKEFGINNISVTGKKRQEIFKKDNTKWNNYFRRCLNGETLSGEKERFITADGRTEWVKWKASPRKNENDEIKGVIVISEIITEKIIHEEKINHILHYDTLTNIPNRYFFQEKILEILKQKPQDKYSVLIFAINNLDEVNNYYSIFIGDLFLQKIIEKINSCLGKDIFVARFDGGQFALILPFTSKSKINGLIEKFNKTFTIPLEIQNYKILVNFHIGIYQFGIGNVDYETIIKNSEIALTYAKSLPNNKFVYFDTGLHKAYIRSLLLENELQQSFDNSQFYMVYQPFFSLHENKIVGIEALARWHHPKLNEISPNEFIPLANKTGIIIQLGYWILDRVLSDIQKLLNKTKKIPDFVFSINLSPTQLLETGFLLHLKQVLIKHNISPKIVQFEVTENQLLQHIDDIVPILQEINKLGCKIAIDDFGTGHSSLERLHELPISVIKIDKCFVDKIDSNEKNTLLVKHILILANEWGLKTIAEGIEQSKQEHILKFLGCNIGQGFYFSKPLLIEDLQKQFLTNHNNSSK